MILSFFFFKFLFIKRTLKKKNKQLTQKKKNSKIKQERRGKVINQFSENNFVLLEQKQLAIIRYM